MKINTRIKERVIGGILIMLHLANNMLDLHDTIAYSIVCFVSVGFLIWAFLNMLDDKAELIKLRHGLDTTHGLWATDKNPNTLMKLFLQQRKVDEPVNETDNDILDIDWKLWVRDYFWQIDHKKDEILSN